MPVSFDDLIPAESKNSAVSFDDLIPQEPTWGDTAVDVGASFASGVGRGVTGLAGLPGTLSDLFNNGMSYVTGLPQLPQSPLSGETITNAANAVSGDALSYDPSTTAGEYAGTVGEFLPGAALGGTSIANLLRFGALPGLASEGAGQITEGTAMEPYARIAASLVAPAVPALAARAVSPFAGAIAPERAAAIRTLQAEGVPLTAGQQTGSTGLRFAESELGGGRAASVMDDQARAFTEAATSRAGMQGIATPDNMAANSQRLGRGFEDISSRSALNGDMQLVGDLGDAVSRHGRLLEPQQRQVVTELADDIINRVSTGSMPGDAYQFIRSDLTRAAQSNRQNSLGSAYRDIRNALDDAMSRSVPPEDAAEWTRLRREYGNMKVLEKAAGGAGEGAAMGTISPARLRQSARVGRQGAASRNAGDFDELAKAGQAVMSPLPNSGTAGRIRAQNLGSGILAGGGALAGGLPGLAAGLVAPQVAGALLMSRAGQGYLTNQLAPRMSVMDPRMQSVIASLLANGGGE
jgi:hypothetical protein